MNDFGERLLISGAADVVEHRLRKITHFMTVTNPGSSPSVPKWFAGQHLQLFFGDVVSQKDADRCRTKAPTLEDIRRAVEFFRAGWRIAGSRILISCDYGASRSPALAYVCVADQLGPGRESDALQLILEIRSESVPNKLVVQLGDAVLARQGALLKPLEQLNMKLNAEISKMFQKPSSR